MKNILLLCCIFFSSSVYANKADVVKARAQCDSSQTCTFTVSVKHNDQGWKHYANKFEVLNINRKVLGTRILFHPHLQEQPFTRSLSNVKISKGTKQVIIRAHDLIHGYGGKEIILKF